LEICGLMTIGAHSDDEHTVRASFARLRGLGESVDADIEKVSIRHLSMGMSGDFEWAIAEGSTMLRLGTALFGARA
ncbi:MAG: alanine racemase, partial [Candidatus Latescibacterota bacterium]